MFQNTAAALKDVMPQLCIVSRPCAERVFILGFAVDLTAVVVYKASHANLQLPCALHIGVVCAMTVFVVDIDIIANIDGPRWRGGAAALASTKHWRFEGVNVMLFTST